MYYYIYRITNTDNNKIYIGVHKTHNLNDGYMGSGKIIRNAIEKYGIDNFKKDILEFFETYEEALQKEKEIVTDEFLLREDTYNLRRGGTGGFDYINKNDLNGNKKNPKYGKTNHFYGKSHSKEVKEKLANLAKKQWTGVPKTEEHKQKIKQSNTGKIFTEERKRNISNSKKGKPSWNKGIPAERWKCPHCGREGGGSSNKTRYHFDNCKERIL